MFTHSGIDHIFGSLNPSLKLSSRGRRFLAINSFEEVVFSNGVVLEAQGTMPSYVYLLLEGSVALYHKPHRLSCPIDDAPAVQQNFIENWQDPKDSGNQRVGSKITMMDGPIFIAEDSVLFKQALMYSIRTESKCLIWRCTV